MLTNNDKNFFKIILLSLAQVVLIFAFSTPFRRISYNVTVFKNEEKT